MPKKSHVILHPDDQDKLDINAIMKVFYTFGISNGVKILHKAWKYNLKTDITIDESINRAIVEYESDDGKK